MLELPVLAGCDPTYVLWTVPGRHNSSGRAVSANARNAGTTRGNSTTNQRQGRTFYSIGIARMGLRHPLRALLSERTRLTWIHRYNWHCPHNGIVRLAPVSRLA